MSVCFNMLKAALCGNYVNFGVLRLYGDTALDKALDMFVKLLVSIPLKSLLVSMELGQSTSLAPLYTCVCVFVCLCVC